MFKPEDFDPERGVAEVIREKVEAAGGVYRDNEGQGVMTARFLKGMGVRHWLDVALARRELGGMYWSRAGRISPSLIRALSVGSSFALPDLPDAARNYCEPYFAWGYRQITAGEVGKYDEEEEEQNTVLPEGEWFFFADPTKEARKSTQLLPWGKGEGFPSAVSVPYEEKWWTAPGGQLIPRGEAIGQRGFYDDEWMLKNLSGIAAGRGGVLLGSRLDDLRLVMHPAVWRAALGPICAALNWGVEVARGGANREAVERAFRTGTDGPGVYTAGRDRAPNVEEIRQDWILNQVRQTKGAMEGLKRQIERAQADLKLQQEQLQEVAPLIPALERAVEEGVIRSAKIDSRAVHVMLPPLLFRQTEEVILYEDEEEEEIQQTWPPGVYRQPDAWVVMRHRKPGVQALVLRADGVPHPHPAVQYGPEPGGLCWGHLTEQKKRAEEKANTLWMKDPVAFFDHVHALLNGVYSGGLSHYYPLVAISKKVGEV